MSLQFINNYYNRREKVEQYSGSTNETVIRTEFIHLINHYCEKKNLILVPELDIRLKNGKTITPDGIVKNALRLDFGYWESKSNVDLEYEIEEKIRKGYPLINTIFEDSKKIILYQDGNRKRVANMREDVELHNILTEFISFEPPQVTDFNKAVEQFKRDIPTIISALRNMIKNQESSPDGVFIRNRRTFLKLCYESINPNITIEDVNEMLIQHILTEEIFLAIFSDAQFLRENNIARELYKMEETFFTGKTKHDTLQDIKYYYNFIKAAASPIVNHHEKQTFLKVIYENFYKAYNPKGADRLGIVYTPPEIIKFMIEGTDYLLEKHFGKTLASKNVEILDPATGTGTFITDLIEYLPKQSLKHKFLHEIHANEIAILPYYIANLNIEYTYRQRMGEYQPFSNICFVDTLDNVQGLAEGLGGKHNKFVTSGNLFNLSSENRERIEKQNRGKISVIIGNPPYNANQMNENDNNKNRTYGVIDSRIKDTYIAKSTAQKTKLYDMYARFVRWASDRVAQTEGIVSFITNRSFIESRTFDGFRKCVLEEFDYCYVLDTQSDVRANPKISGTGHNVFGIQTGVAMMFLVKTTNRKQLIEAKRESKIQLLKDLINPCKIFYFTLKDEQRRLEKLLFLSDNSLKNIDFTQIIPDEKGNWLNQTDNDFEDLLPLASKDVKGNKNGAEFDKAIFKLFSLGVVTARDEWVYDFNEKDLEKKVKFLINIYNQDCKRLEGKSKAEIRDSVDTTIKWTRAVKNDLFKGKEYTFYENRIIEVLYRPFVKYKLYFSRELNEMQYQMPVFFGVDGLKQNTFLAFNSSGTDLKFLCGKQICDLHFIGDSQCLPLFSYDEKGNQIENITDWGLEQFQNKYSPLTTKGGITKERIFHYVYAVLHNPTYRKKYEQNLKRDFPRIPFYDDFEQWASWGKTLMGLHIDYETINPFDLTIEHRAWVGEPAKKVEQSLIFNEVKEFEPLYKKALIPKAKLKADKINGTIELDEKTILKGIPTVAWEYKLGNRSALEWVLDQYKESKPSDPTILDKFNTYRFVDYKVQVIDLLKRVCTVSVETMKIINEMSL